MDKHAAHDLECASAAYALLIERAEGQGDRMAAKSLRRDWQEYRRRALSHIFKERLPE